MYCALKSAHLGHERGAWKGGKPKWWALSEGEEEAGLPALMSKEITTAANR